MLAKLSRTGSRLKLTHHPEENKNIYTQSSAKKKKKRRPIKTKF